MSFTRRFFVTLLATIGVIVSMLSLKLLYQAVTQYKGEISDHYDGERFFNPWHYDASGRSAGAVFKWIATRVAPVWEPRRLPHDIPAPVVSPTEPLSITWIGHSTVLVQTAGFNILTDPVWSNVAGLYGRFGPRRFLPPALDIEDLERVDVVVISHNHYDHLDLTTLAKLGDLYNPLVIVPPGEEKRVRKAGLQRVAVLDWWQTFELDARYADQGRLRVSALPAQHWSRRTPFDYNRSLWSGYWIEGAPAKNTDTKNTAKNKTKSKKATSVYFAGDTGNGPFVEEIAAKFGSPDVALLPIGAFLPRWFMSPAHLSPADALDFHTRLGAAWTMPIHWGAFALGDDRQDEPVEELRALLERQPLGAGEVVVPEPGRRYTPR